MELYAQRKYNIKLVYASKLKCRGSSVVEQHFCKVKVGGSNPLLGSDRGNYCFCSKI